MKETILSTLLAIAASGIVTTAEARPEWDLTVGATMTAEIGMKTTTLVIAITVGVTAVTLPPHADFLCDRERRLSARGLYTSR